jgi:hypothetical protein
MTSNRLVVFRYVQYVDNRGEVSINVADFVSCVSAADFVRRLFPVASGI